MIKKLLSITLIAILVMAAIPAWALAAEKPRAAVKLKITWDANGGKIGTKKAVTTTVTKGNKIGKLPETPKLNGYEFKGWFTNKSGGTKVTTATKPTKAVTYYAQWSKGGADLDVWMQNGKYYMETAMLVYMNNFKAPSAEAACTMGEDGNKSATIIQFTKPYKDRTRIIDRDGYSYTIYDTQKSYSKEPLMNNNGNNDDFELVQISKGTGPVGIGTKYQKTLPYTEYKMEGSEAKIRFYVNGSKVYAYETIISGMTIDLIILKSSPTPPAAIFELKIKGYKELK